ncbi:3-oxoacyl-[acyl-carrier-protein] synthase-3 [Lentzea waywayandensis]|uniref:3-oxoacyl-[acyl-carrier-protein] synthase-3 n=1 Tax=Lentzea waywayandensis TaxID=84724 RepID=A0A1I6FJP2_9PSEU|nr:3-oxoacyl-[acyl-carrier-protein] synthase III C-terminal domain-containing protein [Lentzea waywayandensis]SFR30159.1 3-oxoacyl-[acyl-carrier-protein] synthase-3 [Lentzea waywayandensis]
MPGGVGIRSLAVAFPASVRTNDYFRENYPELVATAESRSLAQVFSPQDEKVRLDTWEREMAPYLADPFRGAVERRILAPGETALDLEARAARRALDAAGLDVADVDLAIVTSFMPDQLGPGNAAYLARELGMRGTAWNVESACSSGLVSLETATALVEAGRYEIVLVVISCTYSRVSDYSDTLAWFWGDGAGAFVVGRTPEGVGVMGSMSTNTASTCDTFSNHIVVDEHGEPHIRTTASKATGRILRDTAEASLRETCEGALACAGVDLLDIDFFVCNSPVAWYPQFCARVLGLTPDKTISTYPLYSNVGPALLTTNLFHGARDGLIKEGDLVLVYTIGSVSTAGASVMRWGQVGLGPLP